MRCEVCGNGIRGKPHRSVIEGARLVVCANCAVLGSANWKMSQPRRRTTIRHPRRTPSKKPVSKRSTLPLEPVYELVEDYGERIRKAREKLKLTHEDLGRKINEKVSVLKKLEGKKMKPNNRLAQKLQHALKIKLLVPATEEKKANYPAHTSISRTLTLGDLVKNEKSLSSEAME